jgi:hypothetical protein
MIPAEVDPFIAALRYPLWAAYVVNSIMRRWRCTRKEATEAWDQHRKRKAIP